MKRFIICFTAVMFLANAFAVSAWAKPCVKMHDNNVVSSSMVSSDTEMPCHQEKKKNTPAKHCDGLCLCLHVAMSQTPIVTDNINLNVPAMSADRVISENDQITTQATAPPRRPPEYIS